VELRRNHQLSFLSAQPGAVDIAVLVVPRASRTRVVGTHGDRLKVQLAAPPVDGEANAALLELFVELFDVPRSAVTLVDGERSKRKRVRVLGLTLAQATASLETKR
jgi:uncharacterized protein